MQHPTAMMKQSAFNFSIVNFEVIPKYIILSIYLKEPLHFLKKNA